MTARLPTTHRVAVVAELARPGRLLDVGAGTCILEPYRHGEYVATDLTADLLAPGDRRVLSNAIDLPFADESFDVVSCVSVLQYVLDVNAALHEFRRVVRPSGQVLVLVPNHAYVRNRLTVLRGRFPWSSQLDSWSEGTIRYFTLPDLLPALSDAGFALRDVWCSGRLWRARSRRPQLLGADLILDLERT